MKKLFYFAIICLIACRSGYESISGNPEDVMDPEVYNEVKNEYGIIGKFQKGLSVVTKNGFYGLLNPAGDLILPCEYDTIYNLSNDIRYIKKDGFFGISNINGEVSVPCQYDNVKIGEIPEYHPVCKNNLWGFINSKNEVVIQLKYDDITLYKDSTYQAVLKGKVGLSRYDGKDLIDYKYEDILYGDNPVVSLNGKFGILNKDFKLITDIDLDSKWVFSSEGLITIKKNDKYGAIDDYTGEVIIPFEYKSLGYYSEGLCLAMNEHYKYGYINKKNEIVLPFIYSGGNEFKEGFAVVSVAKEKRYTLYGLAEKSYAGVIDKNGKFIIDPIYGESLSKSYFNSGLCPMGKVSSNNLYAHEYGYIDISGKWVIEPKYESAEPFENGLAIVELNNRTSVIDTKGREIVGMENYGCCFKDSVIIFYKGVKVFNYNRKGELISE